MAKLEVTPRVWPQFASKPSAPPSGTVEIYARSDGKVYRQTPDGTETELGGGTSSSGSAARSFFLA